MAVLNFNNSNYQSIFKGASTDILKACFEKYYSCDQDANFQLYREYFDRVFEKTDNWRQIQKQTNSPFYS